MKNLQKNDNNYKPNAQEAGEVDVDMYIEDVDEVDEVDGIDSDSDTAYESGGDEVDADAYESDTDTDVDDADAYEGGAGGDTGDADAEDSDAEADAEAYDADADAAYEGSDPAYTDPNAASNDADTAENEEGTSEPSSAKKTEAEALQEETMLAADFVEGLLDIANIGGDLQLSVINNRPLVEIIDEEDPDLRKIIGKDRSGLDALQYITRLAVQKEIGKKSRLLVDINGYSQNSRKLLVEHALEAINTVNETGEEFEFDPMNSFERKLIHDIVRENGLTSYSIDIKENRRVVISPETIGGDDDDDDDEEYLEIDEVDVDGVDTDDGTYEVEVDEVED
jgi:spoIIIJ-associated protein